MFALPLLQSMLIFVRAYKSILYNIVSVRANQPEGVVQRYKKDRYAALRNAKIRLSNIKLEEFTQVMRGKSKWIKH